MKLLFAACIFAATIAPAMAQDAHSAHADHVAQAPTAVRFNLDTPVETIVADAKGKAVLDANLPEMTAHQHYEHFKAMGLRQIHGMAPAQLPAEKLAKIEAELAAIK